jgi:hypothetical protein
MRDIAYFGHLLAGVLLIVLPIVIITYLKEKPKWLKWASGITALIAWVLLLPAGELYTIFYPATKSLIKAGSWPWAHSIITQTNQHWGLLLPVVATTAAGLVFQGKLKESKKWWQLVIVLAILLAIMGKIMKMGAGA